MHNFYGDVAKDILVNFLVSFKFSQFFIFSDQYFTFDREVSNLEVINCADKHC